MLATLMHRGIHAHELPLRFVLMYGEHYDDLVEHDMAKLKSALADVFGG